MCTSIYGNILNETSREYIETLCKSSIYVCWTNLIVQNIDTNYIYLLSKHSYIYPIWDVNLVNRLQVFIGNIFRGNNNKYHSILYKKMIHCTKILKFYTMANNLWEKHAMYFDNKQLNIIPQKYECVLRNIKLKYNTRVYPVKWFCATTDCDEVLNRVSVSIGKCKKCRKSFEIDSIEKKKLFGKIYCMCLFYFSNIYICDERFLIFFDVNIGIESNGNVFQCYADKCIFIRFFSEFTNNIVSDISTFEKMIIDQPYAYHNFIKSVSDNYISIDSLILRMNVHDTYNKAFVTASL